LEVKKINGNNFKIATSDCSQNKMRWRFPRFFVDFNIKNACTNISITGTDAKHINSVLRMKFGDFAIICGADRFEGLCSLVNSDNEKAEFKIIETNICENEPKFYIRLFQCVPKADKLDFIVQKAVETGASEVIPVISQRCISRPDEKSMHKKIERYQKIAVEASKQSGRGIIPKIGNFMNFEQLMSKSVENNNLKIIFYECYGEKLVKIFQNSQNITNIDILIGSEGGFTEQEHEKAVQTNFITATLGNLILRTETAPIAALSIINNLF
jgi:16S rRNA (uracil1498-N3)-methyltransferase